MDELEVIRNRARDLINAHASSPEEIVKASQLLLNAEEIKNQRAEAQKLSKELSQSRLLQFMNLLAPVLTVLILAITLIFQWRQQRQGERDRAEDQDRQRWETAVKSVADTEGKDQTAAILQLRGIEQSSSSYAEQASQLIISILRKAGGFDEFHALFQAEFSPASEQNLDKILDVDRALHQQWLDRDLNPILYPTFQGSDEEHKIIRELGFICTQVHPLLQNRPPGKFFNLSFVAFFDCDLPDVDLTGADLTGFTTARVTFPRANLSGVTRFSDGYWKDTVWWDSRTVSSQLLNYLAAEFPFSADPKGHYGARFKESEDPYDPALTRLRRSSESGK
ncbi:MAG: hypothetical protein WCA76_20665 [Candidatus Sulfotelmatobacter sp.]|jgi:hypothetical protein